MFLYELKFYIFVNYITHAVQVTWVSYHKYDLKNQHILCELILLHNTLYNTLMKCILEKNIKPLCCSSLILKR